MQQKLLDLQQALKRSLSERDRILSSLDDDKTAQLELISQLRERQAKLLSDKAQLVTNHTRELAALQEKLDEKDLATAAKDSEVAFVTAQKRESLEVMEKELKKFLKTEVRQAEELNELKTNVDALKTERDLANEAKGFVEQQVFCFLFAIDGVADSSF